MGRLDGLMLWQLMNINDKIPTAEEVAKAIVDEEVKRREDEKAYWRAWDKAFKEEGIRRLRAHEKDLSFLTFRGEKLYPHISQDKEADLFESGEVRFIIFQNPSLRSFVWDDANREEAQNPNYLELQKLNKQDIESGRSFRII